jgi:transposase
MAKQLSNDMRERIIKAYMEGINTTYIANFAGCHRTTVKRIVELYNLEGRVKPNPRGGVKIQSLNEEQRDAIKRYISEDCSVTLEQIRLKLIKEFSVSVSISTINRAITGLNFSLKRTSLIPVRRNNESTVELRYNYASEFLSLLAQSDGENIFFLDEVGFCVSMRMKRGRAPKGKKAVHVVSNLRTRNISICCTISKNGTFYYKKQEFPFNNVHFKDYIKELLRKFENNNIKNAVLVMDNVKFHHNGELKKEIRRAGHSFLFIPPYSPFLNPIENLFSQWKQMVRRECPKNEEELLKNIDSTFERINQDHCANYYRHMLYMIHRCLRKEKITNE